MPIYEFICQACGNEFERLQSFSDTSTPLCPTCQSVQVRRRLSPPAIHFKGNGWYVTDSKNGAKNGKASTSSTKEGETTGAATESELTKSDTTKSEAVKTESPSKSEGATSTVKEKA